MDQRMSRRTSLDLAQANEIATLKVPLAVPELPQWRVGRAGVKHIAHLVEAVHVQLPYE